MSDDGVTRSFTALVNPIAGGGRASARWAPVGARLSAAGARVVVVSTRSREHGIAEAEKAARRGDVVVAVGGDGLVRDTAQGVVAAGGVMGIVPAGRGNDLARKLVLPDDPTALAEILLHTPERRIDVLDAGGEVVLGNVYAGVDSLSAQLINGNRWLPSRLIYRLAPVVALARWRPPTYTIEIDGEKSMVKAHIVVAANSGAYGDGLSIVPSAEVDDGLIDVLIVAAGPKRRVASFMAQAKTGAHVRRPEVRVLRARTVTLSTDVDLPAGADGDDLGPLPVTVAIRPGALRLLAPP